MKITDEAVTAVALSLAEEVRKWPADSSLPYDSRVGVGRTFRELARVAIEAALPHLEGATPAIDREALAKAIERGAVGADLAKYFQPGDMDKFVDEVMALIGRAL